MRGMGKVAQDRNQRQCKTSMGNGRAKEKVKEKRLIREGEENIEKRAKR